MELRSAYSATPLWSTNPFRHRLTIFIDPRHIDLGSKSPSRGPKTGPYIWYIRGFICQGSLHTAAQVVG
jgi:hypothetical protein